MSLVAFQEPFDRFTEIYGRAAAGPFDHTAVSLATVGPDNQPTTRIVLLKGYDPSGFVVFTNYEGRKGRELLATPKAGLCFYYPWLGEQVRIDGTVEKISAEESDEYFATRPRVSQLGAWASKQSQPLKSREALQQAVAEVDAKYLDQKIPRPPHWGGFRIIPTNIEFWQDGEFRLHDRFMYLREGDGWRVTRLYP